MGEFREGHVMHSADEAIDFFRSRGFVAVGGPLHSAAGEFMVAIWDTAKPTRRRGRSPTRNPHDYDASDIRPPRCCHWFVPGEPWTVRSRDDSERRFASLDDAVNFVLARLQAWLAEHPAGGA